MKPRVALACLLMVLFTAGCDPPPEEEPEAMTAVEWVAKEPESKIATAPTCMCVDRVSRARNDLSRCDSRW